VALLTMIQTSHLWLFGLIVLPGLDMAFVMASALAGGRRAGFAAVAGVVLGGVVHVLMATLGIGIVLRLYPMVFNAMLLVGALYIAWIGGTLWHGAAALGEVSDAPRRSMVQTFWRGALTCLVNPKAYVFMLAIFPQFMRKEYGALGLQAMMMALIITLTQTGVYGSMAWGAGGMQDWLRNNPRSQVQIGRSVGVLLILAAMWTGWQGWRLSA
jgi:threonine/homoserine/homoserine lactone efflux protein